MKSTNLTQISTEGKNMLRQAFNIFLDQIIFDNKSHTPDGYSLNANKLSYEDKKEFLSYLVTIDDYEYFTQNLRRERIAIGEFEPMMQHLINERIDDLYNEMQRELSEIQYE